MPQWEAKVPFSANRGHGFWEQGLQHKGNSPTVPLTTPWLLLHSSFLVLLTIRPTGTVPWGHLEKGFESLKPLAWYHQEDSLGNPKGKRGSWAKKSHHAFLLAWGTAYIWIIITKLRVTIIIWLLSHNDVLINIIFSHYTNCKVGMIYTP